MPTQQATNSASDAPRSAPSAAASSEVAVEAGPAGERLHHVVQRVQVVAAAGVEPEELRPAAREQQHDRQVHHQPRDAAPATAVRTAGPESRRRTPSSTTGSSSSSGYSLAAPPTPISTPASHGSSAGPGQQRGRRESRRQRVEVGERVQDDQRRAAPPAPRPSRGGPRRTRPHRRPATPAPARRRRCEVHDHRQRRRQRRRLLGQREPGSAPARVRTYW